jgi:hypothetical protein
VDVPLGRGLVRVNEFASVCFCSRAGVEFMDSTPKALKAALEASRYCVECLRPDRAAAGDTFDAMGMQRMPVHEAFYSASSIGGGWQMPPMQSTAFNPIL